MGVPTKIYILLSTYLKSYCTIDLTRLFHILWQSPSYVISMNHHCYYEFVPSVNADEYLKRCVKRQRARPLAPRYPPFAIALIHHRGNKPVLHHCCCGKIFSLMHLWCIAKLVFHFCFFSPIYFTIMFLAC